MGDRCLDCGSELEDFVEGSSMGQRCSSCGWSLVTTFTPPILEGEREYTISLLPGNEASPSALGWRWRSRPGFRMARMGGRPLARVGLV